MKLEVPGFTFTAAGKREDPIGVHFVSSVFEEDHEDPLVEAVRLHQEFIAKEFEPGEYEIYILDFVPQVLGTETKFFNHFRQIRIYDLRNQKTLLAIDCCLVKK